MLMRCMLCKEDLIDRYNEPLPTQNLLLTIWDDQMIVDYLNVIERREGERMLDV